MLPAQKSLASSLKNDSLSSTLLGCKSRQNGLKKQDFRIRLRRILNQTIVYPWVFFMMTFSGQALGQNDDEHKVPSYQLPDPLRAENGQTVESAEAWRHRRNQILKSFERDVYGKGPIQQMEPEYRVTEDWTPTLDGKAERK